ncbi:MAG: type II toxin-antitoxin system VapC family toxin [Nanoarchaeota archaeon]|nr:type II toxin-antitoxin system VapC family toxin [Nanoarchaeota archaeon]
MNLTLDTTILAKAIIPPRRRKKDSIYKEQFRLHTISKSIIEKIENRQNVMLIPAVALIEIAAVAARLTGKNERGIQASEYVKEHGNIIYDVFLIDEAVRIAAETKISGFDSIFIACAKLTDSILITDDKNMYEAAIKIGIKAKLLREIK